MLGLDICFTECISYPERVWNLITQKLLVSGMRVNAREDIFLQLKKLLDDILTLVDMDFGKLAQNGDRRRSRFQ